MPIATQEVVKFEEGPDTELVSRISETAVHELVPVEIEDNCPDSVLDLPLPTPTDALAFNERRANVRNRAAARRRARIYSTEIKKPKASDADGLGNYIRGAAETDLLTADEEKELGRRVMEGQEAQTRIDSMVMSG